MSDLNNKDIDSDRRNPQWLPIKLMNIVDDIASGISLEEFQTTVKTLEKKPRTAQKLYSMQVEAIEGEICKSIDYVNQEQNIEDMYNAISTLIANSTDSKKWRPIAGDGDMQYDPYKRKILLEKKQKLEGMLQETKKFRLLLEGSRNKKQETLNKQFEQILNVQNTLNDYDEQLLFNDESCT